jgi:general stress protein YciG
LTRPRRPSRRLTPVSPQLQSSRRRCCQYLLRLPRLGLVVRAIFLHHLLRLLPMKTKRKVGFAAMTKEQHRAIASCGGKSLHAKGLVHQWTRETASVAGRKGAQVTHERRLAYEWDSETAAAAGRKGGTKASKRGQRTSGPRRPLARLAGRGLPRVGQRERRKSDRLSGTVPTAG